MRTTELAEVRIGRPEIEEMEPSTTSLMPEGLEKSMTRQELCDLIQFLTDLRTRNRPGITSRSLTGGWLGSVGKGDWLRAESCEIQEIFEVPPGACPLFRQSLVL